MKEIDDIRTLLNLMNDSIADEIRRLLTSLEAKMSEPHVTIRMMDSDEVQRALNGARDKITDLERQKKLQYDNFTKVLKDTQSIADEMAKVADERGREIDQLKIASERSVNALAQRHIVNLEEKITKLRERNENQAQWFSDITEALGFTLPLLTDEKSPDISDIVPEIKRLREKNRQLINTINERLIGHEVYKVLCNEFQLNHNLIEFVRNLKRECNRLQADRSCIIDVRVEKLNGLVREIRNITGAPIQTDLPSFIRGRLQELTNRLNSVTRDLNATRLQAEARQKRIIKLEERIKFGDQWETELRNALGVAGLHVEGARILDRVREVMSMRMITSTGQRLRDEERERIFRKLTSIEDRKSVV